MPSAQAMSDIRAKLIFERKMLNALRNFDNRMVRDFRREYLERGNIISANDYRDDFNAMLLKQYNNIGDKFSSNISMPSDLSETDDELATIDQSLSLFYLTRSSEQTDIIISTHQNNIADSLEFGIEEAQTSDEGFSRQAAAIFAALALSRKFRGREGTIAQTETQTAAEAAKLTQAEVLSGMNPSLTSSVVTDVKVTKEWFTFGDESVRLSHMVADSQVQNIDEPFIVDGELLRFPGDVGLGASLKNTIGCRCTAVYGEEEIISTRREAIRAQTLFATVN